ncbi:MAG: SDR family oxidoreductase [Bacteroidota bacterium]
MYQKPNQRLKNQTCIVTGGSSGIGAAIAKAIGQEGANVVVNYYSGGDAATEIAAEIEASSDCGNAMTFQADVSKEKDVEAMFAATIEKFGTVDILIANSGIQKDAPFHEMTLDQWQRVIDVNLTGQFLCARAAVREFLRRGMRPDVSSALGKIIHVSSVHEIIPWAGHVNYATAKGGLVMLMQSLAQEYGRKRIRVNSIAPGAVKTPINESVWSDPDKFKEMMKLIPYNRIGQPSDIGGVAAWLASDESDYITGTSIFVDGGMTCYPGFTENG